MGGVLIDQDQAVSCLGDDVGLRDLASGDAKRVQCRVASRVVRRLGAGGGRGHDRTLHSRAHRCARFADPGRRILAGEQRLQSGGRSDGFALPLPHRAGGRGLRRALPRPLQRMAQPADDQPAHEGRIAEAHLGLGRVDIDVDFFAEQARGTAPAPHAGRAPACRHRPRAPRRSAAGPSPGGH